MAVPWLAVLRNVVPWSDVIGNVPGLVKGAKTLLDTVANRSAPPAAAAEDEAAEVRTRLAVAEAAVEELNGQMLATSELIKALADQNAQLIVRVEANRVRVLWLTGVAAAAVAVSLAALYAALA